MQLSQEQTILLGRLVKQALDKNISSKEALEALKRRFLAANPQLLKIRSDQLWIVYRELVERGQIVADTSLERVLRLKGIRTLSGVAPVAVLTKPYPCPGNCVYCPSDPDLPRSYLNDEPAVMRAIQAEYGAYRQVEIRLRALENIGHPTNKVSLIILGGTFTAYPRDYQEDFVQSCFEACNGERAAPDMPDGSRGGQAGSLTKAQQINESAARRMVDLSVETRPDEINEETIRWLRYLGVTRVELGVQSVFDDILEKCLRYHTVQQTVEATSLLRRAGIQVVYHMMLNLPGSDPKRDLEMFRILFSDPRFYPDQLKIYPCVVLEGTELYDLWRRGDYQPYSDKELIRLLVEIKKILPPYVRVNRLFRDIPVSNIRAGSKISNLRQVVRSELEKQGLRCQCIRCREVRDQSRPTPQPKLLMYRYEAIGGEAHFLSLVGRLDRLHGLLRLFLPQDRESHFLSELTGCALICELHVFGQAQSFDSFTSPDIPPLEADGGRAAPLPSEGAVQHHGLGQRLLQEAEKIARDSGFEKIAVTAAVGTRNYYRRFGFKAAGTYLLKNWA